MISFIIPVYNAENYLEFCLDSVLKQSFESVEIILVDDGSKDHTPDICRAYARQYPFIHLVRQENEGPFYARKNGLLKSEGEYVWFVDADDYIPEDSLSAVESAVSAYSPQIIQFGYDEVTSSGQIIEKRILSGEDGLYDRDRIEKEVLPTLFYKDGFLRFGVNPALWNKVFQREYVMQYYADIDRAIFMGEDGLVTFPCYLNASKIFMMNGASLYCYRMNDSSACSTAGEKDFAGQNLLLVSEWDRLLASAKCRPIVEESFESYIFFLMWKALESTFENLKYRSAGKNQIRDELDRFKRIASSPAIESKIRNAKFRNISVKRKLLNNLFLHGRYELIYQLWLRSE